MLRVQDKKALPGYKKGWREPSVQKALCTVKIPEVLFFPTYLEERHSRVHRQEHGVAGYFIAKKKYFLYVE